MASEQKKLIDDALLFSSDAAAEQIALSYGSANLQDFLVSAEVAFFRALEAGLAANLDFSEEGVLDFYVPLLVLVDTDGFYMNYLEETNAGGVVSLDRIWTECQPYIYTDNEFIYRFFLNDVVYVIRKSDPSDIVKSSYEGVTSSTSLMAQLSSSIVFSSKENYMAVKRAAIAECLERAAGRVMNEHNFIAGQYGINMYYSVPSFFEEYSPALEYPSFLAVFQGYPLSIQHGLYYNNCTSSAAYITRAAAYTVELSNTLTQPFSVYHKDGCSFIGTYGIVLEKKLIQKNAIELYGAYACPHCFSDCDGVAILP